MSYNELRIELGAMATGMFYQAQEERIAAFNRIRQIIVRKLEGLGLTEKQEKKEEKDYLSEKELSKLFKLLSKANDYQKKLITERVRLWAKQ